MNAHEVPAHMLFTQLVAIVERYVREKVRPVEPARAVSDVGRVGEVVGRAAA